MLIPPTPTMPLSTQRRSKTLSVTIQKNLRQDEAEEKEELLTETENNEALSEWEEVQLLIFDQNGAVAACESAGNGTSGCAHNPTRFLCLSFF